MWRRILDYIFNSNSYSHHLYHLDTAKKRRLQPKSECQPAGTLILQHTVFIEPLLLTSLQKVTDVNIQCLMKDMDRKTTCESTNKLKFPVIATLAGVLGGTYGIGGGMLISPILLQIGISPQVSLFYILCPKLTQLHLFYVSVLSLMYR